MTKDVKISAIRMISTIMIVAVHIFQQLEKYIESINIVTDCMNLGLVMFCCISAFLYSSRNIDKVWGWYKHRYFEIVIPAIVVGVLTIVFFGLAGSITTQKVYASILSSLGLEAFLSDSWMFFHLWFLTYLLIFYLTLPLVQKINCKCESELKFWVVLGAVILVVQSFLLIIEKLANINLLSFGIFLRFYIPYFVFRRYSMESAVLKKIMKLFALICIPVILITSYVRYVAELTGIGEFIFIYAQTFAGFVLFYWLYQAFGKLKEYSNLLRLSDKYSYAVYLTHMLFIGYKTSIIHNAPNIVVGIILALLLTALSSIILVLITNVIKRSGNTVDKRRVCKPKSSKL